MNWVDIIIVMVLVIFAIEGRRKSFMGELFYLGSFVVSFFLSLRFYNYLASFFQYRFELPHSLANVLGFILIWFLVEAIIFPIIYFSIPRMKGLDQVDVYFNRISWLPALLRGLIFVAILLVLVGTFPVQPQIKAAANESKLGRLILNSTGSIEGPLKKVFGGLSDDTLTFLTVKPSSEERIQLGFKTDKFNESQTNEVKMVQLVNQERVGRGLKSLSYEPKLTEIGLMHSADMLEHGYFSHYSEEGKTVADRAQLIGYNFAVIGENLAYAPNLELAHRGLMNSPGHKANILSEDFNKLGIGIMDAGVYGLMITQVFSN